jgi:hypothetical protein
MSLALQQVPSPPWESAAYQTVLGLFAIAMVMLGVVLLILWIALPFAVFGIKTRLDQMLRLLETIALRLGAREDELPRNLSLMPPTRTPIPSQPIPDRSMRGATPEPSDWPGLTSIDLNDPHKGKDA